jgi:hypothetical protein
VDHIIHQKQMRNYRLHTFPEFCQMDKRNTQLNLYSVGSCKVFFFVSEIVHQMSDNNDILRICLETIVKPTRSLNRSDKNSVMYLQISVGKCGNKCVMISIWGIYVGIFEGYTSVLFFQSFNYYLRVFLFFNL